MAIFNMCTIFSCALLRRIPGAKGVADSLLLLGNCAIRDRGIYFFEVGTSSEENAEQDSRHSLTVELLNLGKRRTEQICCLLK
jgi:hypothetical protein